MRTIIYIFSALFLILAGSALSALAVPVADSFCPVSNSAGANFAGLVFMVVAFFAAFVLGSILAVWLSGRASRKPQGSYSTLVGLALSLLLLPVLSLAASVVYGYQTCPGYGRSLTPEQEYHLKFGKILGAYAV